MNTFNQENGSRRQSLSSVLANQIRDYVRKNDLEVGCHLSAQALADQFKVSRSPINDALKLLADEGIFRHEPQRGYYLQEHPPAPHQSSEFHTKDFLKEVYFRIAEDRLREELPQDVSENLLRDRYGLSKGDLTQLLNRMVGEGWIERRQGYGWRFSEMLTTSGALVQTYRMRAALEPAALLEPTFHIDEKTLDRLADVERELLDGNVETMSTEDLYSRGVEFHETLAEASGNSFILDALRRVNRIRRLIAYRSMTDRTRYYRQAREHLENHQFHSPWPQPTMRRLPCVITSAR